MTYEIAATTSNGSVARYSKPNRQDADQTARALVGNGYVGAIVSADGRPLAGWALDESGKVVRVEV